MWKKTFKTIHQLSCFVGPVAGSLNFQGRVVVVRKQLLNHFKIRFFAWTSFIIQGVPKTWEFSDELDIVFVMNQHCNT